MKEGCWQRDTSGLDSCCWLLLLFRPLTPEALFVCCRELRLSPYAMSEHVQLCLALCRIGLYTVRTPRQPLSGLKGCQGSGVGHAPDPLLSVSLQFNGPLLLFVRPQTSSSCLCFTVAWLLNTESSLVHSSRCLQPYQASVGCKLGIKSRSGLWLETKEKDSRPL